MYTCSFIDDSYVHKNGGREPASPWRCFGRSYVPPATIHVGGINDIKCDLGKMYVTLLPKMGLHTWRTHSQEARQLKRSVGQETTEVTRGIPREGQVRKSQLSNLSSPYNTSTPYLNSQYSLPNAQFLLSNFSFHFLKIQIQC